MVAARRLPNELQFDFKTQQPPIGGRVRKKVNNQPVLRAGQVQGCPDTSTPSKRLKCKMVRVTIAH
jgi:hypothetical protein